ncbi:MAG: hypothetical protein H6Q70_111 [Firmicutes bacterium]|nr:hypothetical protein [Bacillota bacterium]
MMISTIENIIKGKEKKNFKVPGLGLQLDAVGWCIVVIIIAGIVLGTIFSLRQTAKISATKLELGQIQSAVVQYEGTRIDGQPPANLEVLLSDPSIAAADAIDSIEHGAFLPTSNTRWSSGSVTDLWGVAYEYVVNADNTGTITSTGSGKRIPISF